MLRIDTARAACLILALGLAALLPAAAQQTDAETALATAYQAMQAASEKEDWQAVQAQAQALLAAYPQVEEGKITPDQRYMAGMAHYWLMGLTFDVAASCPGLSDERREFAQAMADTVLQRPSIYVISHGEKFDIQDHLVPGKITVFDFYSEYCPPCLAFAPVLEGLAEGRGDLVLVKVDINRPGHRGIDWESPVARQYDLEGIPYMRIYDAEGKMTADGTQARRLLLQWSQEMQQQ